MASNTNRIWRDGSFVEWDDATIHVMSHVVHYGSSVFEGIRCYATPSGPAIFRLPEHMRRFADSCRIYRMPLEHSQETLTQACIDTVSENGLPHCYLRPVAVRTGQHMGVFPANAPLEVFIIPWQWGAYLGQAGLTEGVDVCVSSWRRAAPDTYPSLAKAGGNYLNSQLSLMEARINNYSEGIMLDSFGFVSEGSGENIFVVRDGKIFTSTIASAILGGITRDSVLTIARDMGIQVVEQVIPREMLYISDEAFFVGTAAEITPIRSVDKIQIGKGQRGPVAEALQVAFFDMINGETPDRHGWLTFVYPGEPLQPIATTGTSRAGL